MDVTKGNGPGPEDIEPTRRLVVLSNRVGYTDTGHATGGLAAALGETLEHQGGTWFGWSGRITENPLATPTLRNHGNVDVATLDLTPGEHADYYNGYCNAALWPLFHSSVDRTIIDRRHEKAYWALNRRFATNLVPLLKTDDMVWVHDYHFIPFGQCLRASGCHQPLGFFLHIPFPSPEILLALPGHRALVEALFAYDVVGFQTERDRRCFLNYVLDEAGGHVEDPDLVHAFGRSVRCKVFPIGIDMNEFQRMAWSPTAHAHASRVRGLAGDRRLLLGVDRLDYTKGLTQRLDGFERFLGEHPDTAPDLCYLQLAPVSRAQVSAYAHLRESLEKQAGRINARFATMDAEPLRYVNEGVSREALAGIYSAADVALVTPVRDGMNLVAKEFVAAQPVDDPGVLILSRFAGAAEHALGALVVNPHDPQDIADAIDEALNMEREERMARHEALFQQFDFYDVRRWRRDFVELLARYALRGSLETQQASRHPDVAAA